jgi:two-component system, OmpR family, alkaline phosphatase synthesis response regulator PhoP
MGKILLVDDHPHIVRLLQMALSADGHEVLSASNGVEALEKVHSERPDVVILDVVMPELDGMRVLNRIKTDPDLSGTTVVMLTVKVTTEDIALASGIGADYYLSKPFNPRDIQLLMHRIFSTEKIGEGDADSGG